VARRVVAVLGLRAIVEIVPAGSIARTDFKARRVIDDREAFIALRARLGERA
jgi:phenylacetate-CoA ligase